MPLWPRICFMDTCPKTTSGSHWMMVGWGGPRFFGFSSSDLLEAWGERPLVWGDCPWEDSRGSKARSLSQGQLLSPAWD